MPRSATMRRAAGVPPPRHAPVIRPPVKGEQHSDAYAKMFGGTDDEDGDDRRPAASQRSTPAPPTVYVAHHPTCSYSEDLVALAQECNVEVDVYDVEEVDPPEWLLGTPTLHAPDGRVYCGDAAFAWVVKNRGDAPGARATAPAVAAPTRQIDDPTGAYSFLAPAAPDATPPVHGLHGGLDINAAYARGGQDDLETIANKTANDPPPDVEKMMNSIMQDRG